MLQYFLRRLLLLPITLFFIILVNFIIINLAPGDPVSISQISQDGAQRSQDAVSGDDPDERYLQFREHYGLTLPILWNVWPSLSGRDVKREVAFLENWERLEDALVKEYNDRKTLLGDQSRYILPHLLAVAQDTTLSFRERQLAVRFFIRGATRFAIVAPSLTEEEREYNREISKEDVFLSQQKIASYHSSDQIKEKVQHLSKWHSEQYEKRDFVPSTSKKVAIFFTETRFFRYFTRVLTLDFGTLREDKGKTVIREVAKRFKYSLTLAVFPMFVTFFLCQFFGFIMAVWQQRFADYGLNFLFLILYALPVFVVAPFLIEKVALHNVFPGTEIPVPYSGFQSSEGVYQMMTSKERLLDILRHIALPLVGVMYSSVAVQSRLCRTAVLEVLKQDYVRTAYAKGLGPWKVLIKHVGRNTAITIVTSLAGSLGVVLGGSLIIETIFSIDGFGRFFYEAILSRDYNVIMFSALASSMLGLIGYLLADLAYTLLDPRVTLE